MKQNLLINGETLGASQEDRARYASFVSTTNNPHPLKDVTGSRRYICMTIPKGKYIDNTGEVEISNLTRLNPFSTKDFSLQSEVNH